MLQGAGLKSGISIDKSQAASWRDFLGINPSTLALLAAILLVTAATELWSPLVPQYLKDLQKHAGGGRVELILLIGAYGFYRDGLEAINYFAGGAIAGRFNTRRRTAADACGATIGCARGCTPGNVHASNPAYRDGNDG